MDQLTDQLYDSARFETPLPEPTDAIEAAALRLGSRRLDTALRAIFDAEFDKAELYLFRNVLQSNGQISTSTETTEDEPDLEALAARLQKAKVEQVALEYQRRHAVRVNDAWPGARGAIETAKDAPCDDYTKTLNTLNQRATQLILTLE